MRMFKVKKISRDDQTLKMQDVLDHTFGIDQLRFVLTFILDVLWRDLFVKQV